jgi:hypothetical protein
MKKSLVLSILILVFLASAFAQGRGRQLSPDDQRRFDSYFSRWQDYQRTNNQSEMRSMEKRMQDVYRHYGIPSNTPYARIASNGGGAEWGRGDRDWDRDRDREWDRDRRAEWERYRDRDRDYWRQNQRLSSEDRGRFDSYFQRWQNYRRTNNRDEVISMEKRMFDIYDHYGIPHDVRFERVASNGGGAEWGRDRDWDRERDRDREWDRDRRGEWERYRDRDRDYWRQSQRLSGEDQGRFDSYFQRWLNYRRTNNRDEVISMEKRMFDVYDHYGIPHDVPFERVASQGGRY